MQPGCWDEQLVATCCVETTVVANVHGPRWGDGPRTAAEQLWREGVTSRSFLAFYSSANISLTALSSYPRQLCVPNPGRSGGTGDFPFWRHQRSTLPRNQTGSSCSALTATGQSPGWPSTEELFLQRKNL